MDKNDLEKNKFDLQEWNIVIKTSSQVSWIENIWKRGINDMETNKFDSNWNIRIITAI